MAQREANVKDKSRKKDVGYTKAEFLRQLRHKCNTDDQDKLNWKNKMIIAHHQRMGIKRYSNFPYPGAPDIPLPETDKLIKKAIPTLVLSAWGQKKICTVKIAQGVKDTPEMKAKAKRSELAMNMVLRLPEQGWFRKLMLAADNVKQYGHCIFRIYEKFKTRKVAKVIDLDDYDPETIKALKKLDRFGLTSFIADRYNLDPEDDKDSKVIDDVIKQLKSGDNIIEFDVTEVSSLPIIDVPMPNTITVPAYTTDINEAERIREEFYLSRTTLERLMDDEIFLEKDLDELPTMQSKNDLYSESVKRSEGVTDNTSQTDLYRMEQICCWYKESKKKRATRKIFTFFADVSDPEMALAQEIDFPFEFDGWHFEKHDNEIKDVRYYNSRGVPEQIRAMQEIMERSINNMIIRDEMQNTPLWEVLDTSEIMDAHIRMAPGSKLPVKQLGAEVKQLNDYPRVDQSSSQIMQLLKAYTEEYLAVSDQLFRNATNTGGGKTLGEIQLGIQQNSGPANIEVTNWNDTLSRVYTKVFKIMKERLGESLYIDGEEITREDFEFPAEIRSNGNLEVSNQQLATQKAAMRLQVIMNPQLQDVVNSEDRYNALVDWLEKDGVKDPDNFCTDPKIIAQQAIARMQQQIQQMGQQMEQLQDQAKKQVKRTAAAKMQEDESRARSEKSKETTDLLNQRNASRIGGEITNELLGQAG